jgi:LPS export ABC transporter protein LptC
MKTLFVLCVGVCTLMCACTEETTQKQNMPYNGPISEVYDIKLSYSDSARKMIDMETPVQWQYANENKRFPKEIKLYFYDRTGQQSTTLRGDSGRYIRDRNLYLVKGNVVIINTLKGETMRTEEITWSPDLKKIYTDKTVTLQTREEILTAAGMDATQDFSEYKLRKVTGTINAPQGLTPQ